ncbi:MAG: hypothetical protein UGE21_01140, partial [Lachnospiraceae bacterium]|nr:hypothetical protein [Lachnospiraceae bacterium]
RRVPNGTHGGVRGRELITPSYSITDSRHESVIRREKCRQKEKFFFKEMSYQFQGKKLIKI